jgi:hypothetical protein
MVTTPAAYAWSSYAANAGELPDASLSPHAEYSTFASKEAYRRFCAESDEAQFVTAIRDGTNAGYATLIGEELKSRLAGAVRRPLEPGPRVTIGNEPESLELDF